MSKLVEIGERGRAFEFDADERWHRWIFRRQGDNWIRERRATDWEWYEASLQQAIKEWRPCKLRVAPSDLRVLRSFLESTETALDATTATILVEALQELEERRGLAGDLALINIRESDSRTILGGVAIQVAKLLDIPLWLPAPIETSHEFPASDPYTRLDDGFRDTPPRTLSLMFVGGRMSISIDGGPSAFFDERRSTDSPRVHRAFEALAEAIRLDNIERPQ